MTSFTADDSRHMARALQLARLGMTTAHPNPRVGCVLVRSGQVVGEGWHRAAGEAHAEVNALAVAGERSRGAIAYVTLEPCSRTGRTGPCTEALVRAGIARVVFAVEDPSQRGGRRVLEAAGIEVSGGLMQEEAQRLNEGFLLRVRLGRPFVRLKIAASLDGRTAMSNGESRWITGEAARRDVQQLRAEAGAVLTGVGTILADDPLLTVRDESLVLRQPLRVVLDSHLRTPPAARLIREPGDTLIFCIDDREREALEKAGATVARVAGNGPAVRLPDVLGGLAERGINEVLVEAGPVLSGSMLASGAVDELVIYQAPHMMGSETLGMFTTPGWTALADRMPLRIIDVRRVGQDMKIVARITNTD